MKSYQQFLAESRQSKTEEKYGKILFGNLRKLPEKDTKLERETLRKVYDFIHDSFGKYMSKSVSEVLHELLKIKKEYPDVLEPNSYSQLYRGITLQSRRPGHEKMFEDVKKQILAIPATDLKQLQKHRYSKNYFELPKPITYKPLSEVQSWTLSSDVATIFSGENELREGTISVFFAAKPPRKEMLFNTDFTNTAGNYALSGPNYIGAEHEIVRISKKPLKCKVLVYASLMNPEKQWQEFHEIYK